MVKGTERASLTIGRSFAAEHASPDKDNLGLGSSTLRLLCRLGRQVSDPGWAINRVCGLGCLWA